MIVETADLRSRQPVYEHAGARALSATDARRMLLRIADSRLSASRRDGLSMLIRESLALPDSALRAAQLDVLTTQTRRMMR